MDYNRSLIRQIEDLTVENETLKRDISKLRKDNTYLRQEVVRLKESVESKIAAAVDSQVKRLLLTICELEIKIESKDAEILRLKAVIGKDSSNSSKPPSTNGFTPIPNNREKSAKKRGGQPGHNGHSLKLPENLDKLVNEGTVIKKLVDYTQGSDEYVSKWVVDVDIKTVFTEIRYPIGVQLPPELSPQVIYGSGVKALAVLLEQEGVVAIKRMSDMFSTITGGLVVPSKGSIESFISQFAANIDEDIAAIKEDLLNGLVLNTDDTPMRCAETIEYNEEGAAMLRTADRTTFNVNVRTYSNENATLLTVNPKKDDAGIIRDGVLPPYDGTLGHDHDKKYYKYSDRHATCCEHLGRDLKGLRDLYCCQWADDFRTFLYEMNSYKKKDVSAGRCSCDENVLHKYMIQYDDLVNTGVLVLQGMKPESFGYDELRKMLARLKDYKDAYTLFIRDYTAPFTNNLAERDLRPCKTRQKISGCFRTWKGLADFVKSKSVISTWKKRHLDLFSKIFEVFPNPHFLSAVPSG
jgi:hypothetical protein